MHNNWAHCLHRGRHIEDFIEEVAILVYFFPIDIDKALSHGLNVANFFLTVIECRIQSKTASGFTIIHSGGRNKYTLGRFIAGNAEAF